MSRDVMTLPPRPRPPLTIDPAEFIAVRVIVMKVVADMAGHFEASGAGRAQDWINDIGISCQKAILAADISVWDSRELERMRREAVEQVNNILGSIHFTRNRNDAN